MTGFFFCKSDPGSSLGWSIAFDGHVCFVSFYLGKRFSFSLSSYRSCFWRAQSSGLENALSSSWLDSGCAFITGTQCPWFCALPRASHPEAHVASWSLYCWCYLSRFSALMLTCLFVMNTGSVGRGDNFETIRLPSFSSNFQPMILVSFEWILPEKQLLLECCRMVIPTPHPHLHHSLFTCQ